MVGDGRLKSLSFGRDGCNLVSQDSGDSHVAERWFIGLEDDPLDNDKDQVHPSHSISGEVLEPSGRVRAPITPADLAVVTARECRAEVVRHQVVNRRALSSGVERRDGVW